MPIKFVDRYKEGFQVIVEVVEGEYLLGGRSVSDGTVCDTFREALNYRKVKVGKVVPFRGMVSTGVLVPG